MGRAHAFAFASVNRVFALPISVDLVILADVEAGLATKGAHALGFSRSTSDWHRLVADPDVGIVTSRRRTPRTRPWCTRAIAAGQRVYCEKPLVQLRPGHNRMRRIAIDGRPLTVEAIAAERPCLR